jgi:hypothetical protein
MTKKSWKAPQLRLEESGRTIFKERQDERKWTKSPSVGTWLQENDEMHWKHNQGNGTTAVNSRRSKNNYHIIKKPTDSEKRNKSINDYNRAIEKRLDKDEIGDNTTKENLLDRVDRLHVAMKNAAEETLDRKEDLDRTFKISDRTKELIAEKQKCMKKETWKKKYGLTSNRRKPPISRSTLNSKKKWRYC